MYHILWGLYSYLRVSIILSNPLSLEILGPHFLLWSLSLPGSLIVFIMGRSLLTNHDDTTSHLLLWNLTFPIEGWHVAEPESENISV